LRQYESIELFAKRAESALPSINLTPQNALAVAQICQRLDGIPLAIELAAARVRDLSVEQMVVELADRFGLLKGGRTAIAKHRTMLATMDWSYGLLTDEEQILLQRLSVFSGGWILEAATETCAGKGIEPAGVAHLLKRLVDKSLVAKESRDEAVRYKLLETVRQYAQEKMTEGGEATVVRNQHLNWFLALAERADPEMWGPNQKLWADRLELEHDNLRTALEWSATYRRGSEKGLRLAAALGRFWHHLNYFREGHSWLEKMLQRSKPESTAWRAQALQELGGMLMREGDFIRAQSLFEESLAISRELGDLPVICHALGQLGNIRGMTGDYGGARAFYQESLIVARKADYKRAMAGSLTGLGSVARMQGDFSAAQSFYEESLATRRELGDQRAVSTTLLGLGSVAELQGDCVTARSCYAEALVIDCDIGDKLGVAYLLEGFASIAKTQGFAKRAAQLFGQADALREAIGAPLAPVERPEYERDIAAVRAALSEEEFAAAWAQGRAMTLEQAIECALDKSINT
jgi:non-specific serine/threonine protein kinase